MNTIRLVCFDLGGVLIRICRSWLQGCEAAGLPQRDGVMADPLVAARRHLFDGYQAGEVDAEPFFVALAAATGGLYDAGEARRVHEAWLLGLYPGVEDLIASLATQSGLQLGLLSNTNDLHWERLCALPLLSHITHVHASHLLGLVKPDERIYRRFEELSGFAGAEILFFDDLERNVAAARSVGWTAVRIDHEGDTTKQMKSALLRHGVMPNVTPQDD